MPGTRRRTSPADLSAYLLDRETAHHHALHRNGAITTAPMVIRRTVYTATLTRALPHPQAVDVLDRAGIADRHTAPTVIDDHRICYPPVDPATVCEPLYPDRLAEDFLALTTPGHQHPDYGPDPWAAHAAGTLLAPAVNDEGIAPWPYTPAAIGVLIETSLRWPHIGHEVLYPLLRDHPSLALTVAGATLTRLVSTDHLDLAVLEAIEPLLPHGRHVGLDTAIAAITTRLTEHRLAHTSDDAERARLQVTLGYRLSNAGLYHKALTATVEAVEVYRRLAVGNPAAFEADLARGLWSFAWVRAAGGIDLDYALTAAGESVSIYERLVGGLPEAFTEDLRGALSTYADVLVGLGRGSEAADVRHRIEDL